MVPSSFRSKKVTRRFDRPYEKRVERILPASYGVSGWSSTVDCRSATIVVDKRGFAARGDYRTETRPDENELLSLDFFPAEVAIEIEPFTIVDKHSAGRTDWHFGKGNRPVGLNCDIWPLIRQRFKRSILFAKATDSRAQPCFASSRKSRRHAMVP